MSEPLMPYSSLGLGPWHPNNQLDALRQETASFGSDNPNLRPIYGHRATGPGVGPWVFSQWFPAAFTVNGVNYPHTESFMMDAKARLFEDTETLQKILATTDPGTAKGLGRKVRGFDQRRWDEHGYRIVASANLAKFSQNQPLCDYLLATGDAILVEASPDLVWGVGIHITDSLLWFPARWRGRNLLGFALTEVRHHLRERANQA